MTGMTGKDIFENFTNGDGPGGLSDGAAIVDEVAGKYNDRAARVQQLIGKMDAAWQGDAAGAAMRGFGPVGVEHELAGQALVTAQDLTNRQAGSFGDARNAVVPVPPEPVAPDPWAVFTSPGEVKSYYQQVAEYNAANQHNVDVMTGYSNASVYNANGLPRSYGALSPDHAGMVIDPGTSDTGGGPNSGRSDDGPPIERRNGGEWAGRESGRDAPPLEAGGPAGSAGGPPLGGGGGSVPQQTAPSGFTLAPSGPTTRVPVDAGGLGSGPLPGGPAGGLAPGTGFVPIGGAPDGGPGGRGTGGPGARGGAPGSGSGSEIRGPGGRAGAGEPHSPGGRPGAGPVPGGTPGEPHGVGARGGAGGAAGRGGPMSGGMPLAGGGRGRDEEDLERRAPDYLQVDDPERLFGTDVLTAPPVIGEDLESPDERPDAG